MGPIIGQKIFPEWNTAIDMGYKWKNKEIFGSHKTYRGLLSGLVIGFLVFVAQQKAFELSAQMRRMSLIDYSHYPAAFGALYSFSALLGDLVKSFLKRRFSIKPGIPWIPFDELDWVAGALFCISFIFIPEWSLLWACFVVGVGLHFLVRAAAFLLHFISTPY